MTIASTSNASTSTGNGFQVLEDGIEVDLVSQHLLHMIGSRIGNGRLPQPLLTQLCWLHRM